MDRPASALKELIENSIDAHATQIDLFLAEGGVQEMRVVDNGDGIHPDDFPLLATSHATSKIRHIGDLEFASTLGFRGEALHALSVVSTLRIRSRRDGFSGMEASFSGGEATEILPVGITKGTVVIVQDLFHSLPARLRFLGSSSEEAARCRKVVLDHLLAHPQIAFTLKHGNRTLLRSGGNNHLPDLASLSWGQEVAACALPIEIKGEEWALSGLLTRPDHGIRGKKGLHVSVNGRPVSMPGINAGLKKACSGWMGDGRSPQAILRFTVPADRVDVNVHPTKSRVALRVEGWSDLLIQETRKSLTSLLGLPSLSLGGEIEQRHLPLDKPVGYLGIVFGTFLVFTQEDELILLDGHAASERVLYEELGAQAPPAAQPLLSPIETPLPIQVSHRRALWKRLGILWEEHPTHWLVTALPPHIPAHALSITDAEEDERAEDFRESLRSGACRGSWRGGMEMNSALAQSLWNGWIRCQDPWTCPHGRRVALRLQRDDAERLFQRKTD
ncbi:ATP-binding protein [bacterium]|nr:ATP-binding protein [bacterium]